MKIFRLYDPKKTYMYPNATLATPESVADRYPATAVFTHMVETDPAEQVMFALENLSAARARYGVDDVLSETEAVAAIEEMANQEAPPAAPDAQERIAAALEFQNLISL